jgi:hypothetical protein
MNSVLKTECNKPVHKIGSTPGPTHRRHAPLNALVADGRVTFGEREQLLRLLVDPGLDALIAEAGLDGTVTRVE